MVARLTRGNERKPPKAKRAKAHPNSANTRSPSPANEKLKTTKKYKRKKEARATPLPAEPAPEAPEGDAKADVHLTDLGNARRVVGDHGQNIRFCYPLKSWFVWDGRRWREDDTAEAVRCVKDTQSRLFRRTAEKIRELGELDDKDERKGQLAKLKLLLNHCLRWEDARRITACLELARSERGIPILPDQLNTDPWLFNLLNGTLDLRKGRLLEHQREDYITKLAPVEYRPDAQCPLWLKFLDRIMDGNKDLIGYLQRVIGYSLTGNVSEHALWFFYGAGANGKSTLLLTILALLGEYGCQAVSDLLLQKATETHPTERADLFGRRFVATIETDEGRRMAEALTKQMTGGDKIRARKLYKDFFEFSATHKIFLAANHKPLVRGTDHALWRRIKLVPFTVTIPDEERDKELPAKLQTELPGILTWAVSGCLDWQTAGLGEPDEVRQATSEYQAEQDTIAGFVAACCFTHPEARCRASILLESYLRWSGDKLMTPRGFAQRLEAKNYVSKRGTGGYHYWHGIGLPSSESSE